ncbi:phosphate ABC transporter substrate-binding protein [Anaerolineaceae bacterium oral taxon 439]|nr:phosphate ABC transporter substrate-binding protein [Anaerolineaceae bacterium oral taxon 439]
MKKRPYVVFLAALIGLIAAVVRFGCEPGDPFEIAVISREDGSGTRSAFVELTGIEETDPNGEKIDQTTVEAIVANNTNVVMTTVAGNRCAVGYISLGSLNETVKPLKIDGVEISVESIHSDEYKLARPFTVAYRGELSETARDFLDFVLSDAGQAGVASAKYVPVSSGDYRTDGGRSGKIVIGGSSSVAPVMEKLKEAYRALNPGVEIEVQPSDSTTGALNAIEGIVDLAMASRELKGSEREALTPVVIARDGIAVIVHRDNPIESITLAQLRAVFTGELLSWNEFE